MLLVGTGHYCGFSGEGTIGFGHEFTRFRPKSRLHDLLAVGVAGCAAQHQRFGWTVELRVETTGLEIVDVEVAGHTGASAPLRSCITELVWALELPAGRWQSRELHLLRF